MMNYDEALEDMSKEIERMADAPDQMVYEQTLFENQLFRNRIKELEEEQKRKEKQVSNSEDMVQM